MRDDDRVSVPYLHREVSSQVARDGVTDVLVRVETDDGAGRLGRGLQRRRRGVGRGRDPRDGAVRDRPRPVEPRGDAAPTCSRTASGSSAPAPATSPGPGVDMALADLCGTQRRRAAVPAVRRAAAAARCRTSTTSPAAATTTSPAQCARRPRAAATRPSTSRSASTPAADLAMVAATRRGARRRARGCGSTRTARWSVPDALRLLRPAWRSTTSTSSSSRCATTRSASWRRCGRGCRWRSARTRGCGARPTRTRASRARQADVYCFSPYWVGSLGAFHRLAHVAHLEGLQVCKHTHGELGLAAAACAARAADAAEHRRGPPADRARDGVRRPDGAAADRDRRRRWGVPEGAGPGRRGRRRRGARGAPAATSSRASSCPTSASSWAARGAPSGRARARTPISTRSTTPSRTPSRPSCRFTQPQAWLGTMRSLSPIAGGSSTAADVHVPVLLVDGVQERARAPR